MHSLQRDLTIAAHAKTLFSNPECINHYSRKETNNVNENYCFKIILKVCDQMANGSLEFCETHCLI